MQYKTKTNSNFKSALIASYFNPKLLRDSIPPNFVAPSGVFDASKVKGMTQRQAVGKRVKIVLLGCSKIDNKKLSLKSNLRQQFGLDGLNMTEIVLTLETVFLITIPQKAITDQFDTPLDIIDYICTALGIR